MLFRYPGGKSKIAKPILEKLRTAAEPFDGNYEYREPFFGAGAIGIKFIEQFRPPRAWINDKDPGIASIWFAVAKLPEEFKQAIRSYIPTKESFYENKSFLENSANWRGRPWKEGVIDVALRKLTIHQISYSGLGMKAGGPLGGKDQSSPYGVGCRWSPNHLVKQVEKLSGILNSCHTKILGTDYLSLIERSGDCVIYLDPPYYLKGPNLYQFSFTGQDHEELAVKLRGCTQPWVLSYDNHPLIRELYDWASIEEIPIKNTIRVPKGETAATPVAELLITPKK